MVKMVSIPDRGGFSMTPVVMVLTCLFQGVALETCECHCSTEMDNEYIQLGTVTVAGSCDTAFSSIYLPAVEEQRCMQGKKIQCDAEDLYPIAINDRNEKDACLCVAPHGVFDQKVGCKCDAMVEHNDEIVNCVNDDGHCLCTFTPPGTAADVTAVIFQDIRCEDKFDTGPGSDKCTQNIECGAYDLYDITGMTDTCLCNAASLTEPTVCECKRSVEREDSVMCSCEERITTLPPSTKFVSVPPSRNTPFQDRNTPFTTTLAGSTPICENCTGTGSAENLHKGVNGVIIGVIFALGLVLGMATVIVVMVICRRRMNSKNGKSSDHNEVSKTHAISNFKGDQYSTKLSNDNGQAEIPKSIESYSSYLTPMDTIKPTAPPVADGQPGGTNTYTYIDINVPSSGAEQVSHQNPKEKQLGLEGKYAQGNGTPPKYDYVELSDASEGKTENGIAEQEFKYDYVGIVRQGDVQDSTSPYDGLNRAGSPPPKSPTYLSFDYGHLGVANSSDVGSPYDQVNRDTSNEKSTNERLELPEAHNYGHLNANDDDNTYNEVNHGPGERRKPAASSGEYGVLKSPTLAPGEVYAHFNRNNDLESKDNIDSPMLSYSEPYNQVNLVSENTLAEYSQLHH